MKKLFYFLFLFLYFFHLNVFAAGILAYTNLSDSPDPAWVGDNITYTVSVTNQSSGCFVLGCSDNISSVLTTSTIPSGMTWVSGSGCAVSGSTITCNFGTLNEGTIENATFTLKAPSTAGAITLNTTATGNLGIHYLLSGSTTSASQTTTIQAPTLSIANASLAEGNTTTSNMNFTVTLSRSMSVPVTVNYATSNGTATVGEDYTNSTGTLTFAAGTTSKTISVPIIGDTNVENNETFTVTLSNPSYATISTATATGTIINDDTITPTLNYQMDECKWNGTSEEVKDSNGSDYHATAKGTSTPQLSTQIINNGALFSRTNQQYIQLPTLQASKPNFNDGFSITTWAKFSNTAANWERIFDFGNGTDSDNIILARNASSSTLTLAIHGSNFGDTYLDATNAITDTNWHFWSVTCNGSTCKLYKDGTQIASSSTMKTPSNIARTQNFIGKSNWSWDGYFEGGIDEFKVFDSTLSTTQIATIYTNELAKKNYDGTTRSTVSCGYCAQQNLAQGYHIIDPDGGDTSNSFEIYCDRSTSTIKDIIKLPISKNMNTSEFSNFKFNASLGTSANYYDDAHAKTYINYIRIDANTMQIIPDSSTGFYDGSFSNLNLKGTPFTFDWDSMSSSDIQGCNLSKMRRDYDSSTKTGGQVLKINPKNESVYKCSSSSLKLKLLPDYQYLIYEGNEVLKKSCKTISEFLPASGIYSNITGYYYIDPKESGRSTNQNLTDYRPFVAYCMEVAGSTNADQYSWTMFLNLDGVRTTNYTDITTGKDTCSQMGLVFFAPNNQSTFNKAKTFLYNQKSQWSGYTGNMGEYFSDRNIAGWGTSYETSRLYWPYGPMGLYATGNSFSAIISGVTIGGKQYGYDLTSTSAINSTSINIAHVPSGNSFKTTLQDIGYTSDFWITTYSAGAFTNSAPVCSGGNTYACYLNGSRSIEPNSDYDAGNWLHFWADDNGTIYHYNDQNGANRYRHDHYMCMAKDNYQLTKRFSATQGMFTVIEQGQTVTNGMAKSNLNLANTTKIVNAPLNFGIVAFDNTLTKVSKDQNVSAGVFLVDIVSSGTDLSLKDLQYFGKVGGSSPTFNTSTNGYATIPSFTQSSAKKQVTFQFKYCATNVEWTNCWTRNGNSAQCTTGCTPNNSGCACLTAESNNFAIRPKNFELALSGSTPYKAGETYTYTFKAKDYNNVATTDYNESIAIDYNETKSGCLKGIFSPTLASITMQNGTKDMNTSYNQIGKINVKIAETLGSEFAIADDDDTNESQRLITPYDQNISFSPHHFTISNALIQSNTNASFVYLDTNLTNYADINFTVTAKTLDNNITTNYNQLCYAKLTDYNISYDSLIPSPNSTALTKLIYNETNSSSSGTLTLNAPITLNDVNTSIFTTDVNGSAKLNFRINFDRNVTIPTNPLRFILRDVNVSDDDNVTGTTTLNDQNITFYYGRVHAPDQRFSGTTGTANIYYEVYCRNCTSAFRTSMGITGNESVDAVNWYQNTLHVNNTFGEFNSTTPSASSSGLTLGTRTLSTQNLTATSTPHVNRINFGSSSWLRHYPEYFKVEFIGSGTWAGEGSVDRNQTAGKIGGFAHDANVSRAHRRMNW